MNDEPLFIAIPRSSTRPTRIDAILQRRMKDFLLMRRRKLWREEGE